MNSMVVYTQSVGEAQLLIDGLNGIISFLSINSNGVPTGEFAALVYAVMSLTIALSFLKFKDGINPFFYLTGFAIPVGIYFFIFGSVLHLNFMTFSGSYAGSVGNVPMGLGFPLATMSVIEKILVDASDQYLMPVDGHNLEFKKWDFLGPVLTAKSIYSQETKVNGGISKTIEEYIDNCLLQKMTLVPDDIKITGDLLEYFRFENHAFFTNVTYQNGSSMIMTCANAYQYIRSTVVASSTDNSKDSTAAANTMKVEPDIFQRSGNDKLNIFAIAEARMKMNDLLNTVFTGFQTNSEEAFQQMYMINSVRSSLGKTNPELASYWAQSSATERTTSIISSVEYIDTMRRFRPVLKLAVAFMFPLFGAFFLTQAGKPFLGWVSTLLWVSLWLPMEAIVHAAYMHSFLYSVREIIGSNGVTLSNQIKLSQLIQTNADSGAQLMFFIVPLSGMVLSLLAPKMAGAVGQTISAVGGLSGGSKSAGGGAMKGVQAIAKELDADKANAQMLMAGDAHIARLDHLNKAFNMTHGQAFGNRTGNMKDILPNDKGILSGATDAELSATTANNQQTGYTDTKSIMATEAYKQAQSSSVGKALTKTLGSEEAFARGIGAAAKLASGQQLSASEREDLTAMNQAMIDLTKNVGEQIRKSTDASGKIGFEPLKGILSGSFGLSATLNKDGSVSIGSSEKDASGLNKSFAVALGKTINLSRDNSNDQSIKFSDTTKNGTSVNDTSNWSDSFGHDVGKTFSDNKAFMESISTQSGVGASYKTSVKDLFGKIDDPYAVNAAFENAKKSLSSYLEPVPLNADTKTKKEAIINAISSAALNNDAKAIGTYFTDTAKDLKGHSAQEVQRKMEDIGRAYNKANVNQDKLAEQKTVGEGVGNRVAEQTNGIEGNVGGSINDTKVNIDKDEESLSKKQEELDFASKKALLNAGTKPLQLDKKYDPKVFTDENKARLAKAIENSDLFKNYTRDKQIYNLQQAMKAQGGLDIEKGLVSNTVGALSNRIQSAAGVKMSDEEIQTFNNRLRERADIEKDKPIPQIAAEIASEMGEENKNTVAGKMATNTGNALGGDGSTNKYPKSLPKTNLDSQPVGFSSINTEPQNFDDGSKAKPTTFEQNNDKNNNFNR